MSPGSYEHGVANAPNRYKDADEAELREAAQEGEGGAPVRKQLSATELTQRTPLLQRPAEEQPPHFVQALRKLSKLSEQELAALVGHTVQLGQLPGSGDADAAAFQVAVSHVPGTAAPSPYDDCEDPNQPAPQPALTEKVKV